MSVPEVGLKDRPSKGRRVCADWHLGAVVMYEQVDTYAMEAAEQLASQGS